MPYNIKSILEDLLNKNKSVYKICDIIGIMFTEIF